MKFSRISLIISVFLFTIAVLRLYRTQYAYVPQIGDFCSKSVRPGSVLIKNSAKSRFLFKYKGKQLFTFLSNLQIFKIILPDKI